MLYQLVLIPVYLLSLFPLQTSGFASLPSQLQAAPTDTAKVLALTDLAWEYLYNSTDTSRKYCQEAYALGKQLNYQYGMGLALETEGIILHNSLQWEAATASFLAAAKHYETAGAKTAFAGLYNNLGLLLLDTQDTLRALDYLERGLAYEMEAGDTSDMLISQINIYVLYSATGQLDRAEEGFRSILPIAKDIRDLHLEQAIRGNLAVIDLRRGKYPAAAEQFRQLLTPGPDSLRRNQLYISTTTSLAEALFRLQQPGEAAEYIIKARNRMEQSGDQRYLLNILQLEVEQAKSQGNLQVQVEKLNLYHAVKDSVAEAKNLHQIAVLNANYEYLRQREEIASLNLENAIEAQRLQRERILYAGVFLAIFLIGWFSYQRYRQKLITERAFRAKQAMELQYKSSQLHTFTSHLADRNQRIQELEAVFSEQDSNRHQLTARLSSLAILTEEDWCKFQQLFHEVHPDFLPRMRRDAIGYTEGELRLAALISLGLDRQTIANILGISSESVRKNVYRLEKKVALDKQASLVGYLNKYQVAAS